MVELTAPQRDLGHRRVVAQVLREAEMTLARLPHRASMPFGFLEFPGPRKEEREQFMRLRSSRTTALEDPATECLRFGPATETTQRLGRRSFEFAAPGALESVCARERGAFVKNVSCVGESPVGLEDEPDKQPARRDPDGVAIGLPEVA